MCTEKNGVEEIPMKMTCASFFRKLQRDQKGQAMIWVAFALGTVMMGVGGFTIDLARFYSLRTELQNSTNAAGLAATGAAFSSNSTSNMTAVAKTFAADNPVGQLQQNSGYPQVVQLCLNQLELMTSGNTCASVSNVPNALRVYEQVSMPTMFMRLFGVKSLNVGAEATASLVGTAQPLNIALIVDSTGSMNSADGNCGTTTSFACALQAVQTMLTQTNPNCTVSTACPSGYKIHMALFTFPNVSVQTAYEDINCNGTPGSAGYPTALPNTFPLPTATSYVPLTYTLTASPHTTWTATYEITYNMATAALSGVTPAITTNGASDADANGFVTDWYVPATTNTPATLNTSSSLVKAVGHGGSGGTTGCLTYTQGIVNSSMGDTYFAGAIYAAQSALLAEQAQLNNVGTKNVIVFVGDGKSSAFKNQFPDSTATNASIGCNSGTYSGSQYNPPGNGNACGTATAAQTGAVYLTPATVPSTQGYSATAVNGPGLYPDLYDQCQQAITAAQYAATYPNGASTNPTTVYGVAYGSSVNGCSNGPSNPYFYWDTSLVDHGTYNVSFTVNPSTLRPCQTVEDIASSLPDFYSDYVAGSGGNDTTCVSADNPGTSLNSIFSNITSKFLAPRLVSNSLT
jgi:Putative Flp pilus-assembly TadE/G-like